MSRIHTIAHSEYPVCTFLGDIEPYSVIADHETQAAKALELLDCPLPLA